MLVVNGVDGDHNYEKYMSNKKLLRTNIYRSTLR